MVTWRDPPTAESPLALETSLAGLIVVSEDISFTLNEYTSAQTLTGDNYLVLLGASGGSITVTLPAAVNHKNRVYIIKKIDSSVHKVTIDANSDETIDGETTIALGLQFDYVTIVSDADEWHIIGGRNVKMEDLLEDIKEIMQSSLESLDRLLVKTAEIEKHEADSSEADIDREQIEEELRDLVPEVSD